MIKIKNIVLSGGGINSLSFLGAFKAIDESDILDEINTYVGTSAGSMISALLIAGFKHDEIYNFCLKFDFSKTDTEFNITNLFEKFGANDGNKVMYVFNRLLLEKGFNSDTTLKSFYEKTKKKLIICATCVNECKVYYFDYINYPDLELWKAIRMSISIPLLFEPYKFEDKLFVDGGVVDNFPIQLLKDSLDETLGLSIIGNDFFNNETEIDDIFVFIKKVFSCSVFCNVNYKIRKYIKNVITINCERQGYEYNINEESKSEIFEKGYDAAKKFIKCLKETNSPEKCSNIDEEI